MTTPLRAAATSTGSASGDASQPRRTRIRAPLRTAASSARRPTPSSARRTVRATPPRSTTSWTGSDREALIASGCETHDSAGIANAQSVHTRCGAREVRIETGSHRRRRRIRHPVRASTSEMCVRLGEVSRFPPKMAYISERRTRPHAGRGDSGSGATRGKYRAHRPRNDEGPAGAGPSMRWLTCWSRRSS